jgi:hypothetical protein
LEKLIQSVANTYYSKHEKMRLDYILYYFQEFGILY